MKKTAVIILCFCHFFVGHDVCGQDTSFRFVEKISYPVNYFTTNMAGELFTINSDNLLKKYNINGDSVGVFNDVKKYGRLSYVEAQNPWKTILFYESFQTIVLLDKYLKNLGSINLRDKNIFNVSAVTSSYDNNIWVFDGRDFRIKKIDDNGNLLMASNDLRQVFDDVPSPRWIADRDGLLYLYDPEKGFYIFDYYGAFKMILPFKNWKSVYVFNKQLIGFDDTQMYRYTPPVPLAETTVLPPDLKGAESIGFSANRVYVLKKKDLTIYETR